jgi:hypothetical protein
MIYFLPTAAQGQCSSSSYQTNLAGRLHLLLAMANDLLNSPDNWRALSRGRSRASAARRPLCRLRVLAALTLINKRVL